LINGDENAGVIMDTHTSFHLRESFLTIKVHRKEKINVFDRSGKQLGSFTMVRETPLISIVCTDGKDYGTSD